MQAGLVSLIGFVISRRWGSGASSVSLVLLALAAWVGELVVVSLLAPFLAGELSFIHGPAIWLVATGGPIQPLAAVLGVLIGMTSSRSERLTQPR